MYLVPSVGWSAACADVGLLVVGTVALVAGNAGIGGVLPGRGVPLLTLNHVSPVQGSPSRILFCCLVSSVWYCIFNVAIVSSYNCSSVVFQLCCWNWAPLVWHEECFALCSVQSDQISLAVECPEVISVPQELHTCWRPGDWCDLCCCALVRLMYFQLHVDWNFDKLHCHEVESITLNKRCVESLCVCVCVCVTVGVSLSCMLNPCSASLVTDRMGCVTSHTKKGTTSCCLFTLVIRIHLHPYTGMFSSVAVLSCGPCPCSKLYMGVLGANHGWQTCVALLHCRS